MCTHVCVSLPFQAGQMQLAPQMRQSSKAEACPPISQVFLHLSLPITVRTRALHSPGVAENFVEFPSSLFMLMHLPLGRALSSAGP